MFGAICLISLLLAQQPGNALFETEMWPEEGRPVLAAGTTVLHTRRDPISSAPALAPWRVSRNQQLAFDLSRFRTVVAGQILVSASSTVTGRALGQRRFLTNADYYSAQFSDTTIQLAPGDSIQYLQYRAEGTCFVQVQNQVIDADPCPALDSAHFRVVLQPRTEWWVRLLKQGTPAGWVLVRSGTVRVVRRTF